MNRQTAIKQLEAINIELYDYGIGFDDKSSGVYLVREYKSSLLTTESYISWDPDSSHEFLVKRKGWNPQEAKSLVDAFATLTGIPKMTPEEERQFLTSRSEYDRTIYHFKKAEAWRPEYRLVLSDSCLSDGTPVQIDLMFWEKESPLVILMWRRSCGINDFTVEDFRDGGFFPAVNYFETFTEAFQRFMNAHR